MPLQALGERPDLISIEALDEEIVRLNAHLTAREYEFLVLIRSFDERGGWLKWGSASCAHWLHWRCDLGLSAAREKVRVAHALKCLPAISAAFAEGALSYSKVRALTRVADPGNEAELLEFALSVSAAIVEQHVQQRRNVDPASTALAHRAHERRALSAYRNPSRGLMTLNVEVPLEDGELILNALDKLLSEAEERADASTAYRARQADALLDLCRSVLAEDAGDARAEEESLRGGMAQDSDAEESLRGGAEAESLRGGLSPSHHQDRIRRPISSADQYQVVIHADASALTDHPAPDARADLPVETVRRLTCDGTVVPIASDTSGAPLHIGRKRRTLPTALRRALWARDRHCRFPGCSHDRFVDAHHVQHWAQGGETGLDNLMLLCSHHHRLVHEGGFRIIVDQDGKPFFRRPDGRAVPACGYRPEDQMDEDVEGSG